MSMISNFIKWGLPAARDIHFDIDEYLDRFVPHNQAHRFPKPIARFLGHRDTPAPQIGNILVAIWALVGAFLGLLVVGAMLKFSSHLQSYHPPILFASLGATAILDYNTIKSPLAQPRAAIVGHGISALVGVSIARLFMLSPSFEALRWVAGPIACALASFLMAMTNTVHPPGGATAVLAAVDPTITAMGWMFIPFILLGSGLMFAVALLVNNIQRQFPVFWWTPNTVGWDKEKKKTIVHDVESMVGYGVVGKSLESPGLRNMLVLTPDRILVPDGFVLDPQFVQSLQSLRELLREWKDQEEGRLRQSSASSSCGSEKTAVERSSDA